MWMKNRSASQSASLRLRLVNIPSGSERDSILFKDVMPVSSTNVLLGYKCCINCKRANACFFPVLRFVPKQLWNNFAFYFDRMWFEDADEMIGESFFITSYRVDRTIIFSMTTDNSSIVAEGQSTRWELRVGSWESKEKETWNFESSRWQVKSRK